MSTNITPAEVEVEPLFGYDRVIDDITSWIRYGVERGWVAEPCCATHDGIPATIEEVADEEVGGDPCQAILRLWPQGHIHTPEDDIDVVDFARLLTDSPLMPEPLEGPVMIEMTTRPGQTESGEPTVHNVIHVDGVERDDANVQIITALGGSKVVFLDGQQVKHAQVWADGILVAATPGIDDLTSTP